MSYLKSGGDGVYNIPALNASGQLYIRGKKFEDYLNELTGVDVFEANEIAELKTIVQRIDISNLSGNWTVDDTNRNAVLKTRLDNTDASLNIVDGKTRYVVSAQGNDSGTPTPSYLQVSIADRIKRQISLTTGANAIGISNNSTTQATAGEYGDNYIQLSSPNGMISSDAHLNRILGSNKIEISSGLFGVGSSSGVVNIGALNNKINIGSVDTPEVGATTTEITIGKRAFSKNTSTTLAGNLYTGDARWESLSKSSALTWTQLLSLVSTSGLPSWVASFALTSSIPNFSYSDVWTMKAVSEAGGLIKNGEVETSTGAKLKSLTVYDNEVGIDILAKEGTFFAKGDISKTTLFGSIRMQTFNGEVLLRNNNVSATNINWALTDAMDNVNALKLSNNDVELIAGAGADGSQLRISNTTRGPIKLRMGNGKLQSNAHDAMSIYNNQAVGTSQVVIGDNDTFNNRYDAAAKMTLDMCDLSGGLTITKKASTLKTLINNIEVDTGAVKLQTDYAGTTANRLYSTTNGNKLFYDGKEINTGSGGGTSSGLGSADDVFAATLLPRKQTTYGYLYNWSDTLTSMPFMGDIWVNRLGTLAMVATGEQGNSQPLRRTAAPTNDNSYPLGTMWNTVSPAKYWWSICGSDTGDRIYALSRLDGPTPNQIWLSGDFGITFTLFPTQPPTPFGGSTMQGKIRCSGDGKYILIHDWVGNGRIYRSADYGTSWTTTQVAVSSMQIRGIAVSATGQYQFLALYGGGVRRSIDYGATWIQGNPNALNFERVACSASGKVVVATINGVGLKRSMDYGQTWFDNSNVATDVNMSATGNLVWIGTSTGTRYSIDFGNTFFEPYLTNAPINNIVMSSDGGTVMASRASGLVHLTVENPNRVIQLTAGSGMKVVETQGGIYQLSLSNATNPPPPSGYVTTQSALGDGVTPTVGGGNTPEQDRITATTCVIPRKIYWYGTYGNWNLLTTSMPSGNDHRDCFMSATGKYILTANGTDGMPFNQYNLQLNSDYGESAWSNTASQKYWKSVCGSSAGDRMYGLSVKWALGDTTNTFWSSSDYGVTWGQINTMPTIPQAFSSDATLSRVRCCGLGRNVYIGSGTAGIIYRSNDFGANWTETQIVAGTIGGLAVNATGQYVFVSIPSVGIYRSYDYGATFTIISNSATAWLNICCSATAQFVVATRSGATYAYSTDYGASWIFGAANYVDCAMSPCGNLLWFCYTGGVAWSDNNGKTIQTTYGSGDTHRCIAMSNDGNYVFSGLAATSGKQAYMIREQAPLIRNLNSGTGISITGDSTSGSYTITNTLAPTSNTLYNQKITNVVSMGAGLTNNGWSVTLNWDFTNYEYDIQFDLQIGAGGYYPGNIFWIWHDIYNANQYHHAWHDHDGATYHGAGQDYDNRITFIQQQANMHHNCNFVLKQVRCPNINYYQRINLIGNISSLTLPTATSSMASSKIAFSNTHNYCMSASTSDTYFNGTKTLVFYCNLNYSAVVGNGNDAWLKIRRIPIT